jgi:hypothetical protein
MRAITNATELESERTMIVVSSITITLLSTCRQKADATSKSV